MHLSATIIIPAYNEDQRIGTTLDQYLHAIAEYPEVDICVVVNGSSDRTEEVVRSYMTRYIERLHIMVIPEKVGKGGAIVAGFKSATKEYVGFVDADAATPAVEYLRLLKVLSASGHEGIIASRWMRGSQVTGRDSTVRRLGSWVFHRLVHWLFWMPFVDTQCGAKIFRTSSLQTVLPKVGLVKNMVFDIELLYRMWKAGYTVTEEPSIWQDQKGSTVNMRSDSWKMLKTLLWFRWVTFME